MGIETIENKSGFMTILGSCLPAIVPDDLDSLLHDEVLIDRRNKTPMEMDGYSYYLACKALEKAYQVDLGSEKKRIVDACVKRCKVCDGFWSHGAWTGSPKEIHMRFTSTAIRLLVEGYKDGLISDSGIVIKSMRKHLEFSEPIDSGIWFFHDSLELPSIGIEYPFKNIKNQVWGSSPTNMLVLNTHIDTLVTILFVLRSIKIHPDDKKFLVEKLAKGVDALKAVLKLNPSFAWKVFSLIDSQVRYFLFNTVANDVVFFKVIRKIIYKFYFPVRHLFRSKVPGFVFEDGYIERDISLGGKGYEYHFVNVWDLAKFIKEAGKSEHIQDKEFIDYCMNLVGNGINYAVSNPYWKYVLETTKKQGGAMEICESIIIMQQIEKSGEDDEHWKEAYDKICSLIPPSPALMGYDPLILDDTLQQSSSQRLSV